MPRDRGECLPVCGKCAGTKGLKPWTRIKSNPSDDLEARRPLAGGLGVTKTHARPHGPTTTRSRKRSYVSASPRSGSASPRRRSVPTAVIGCSRSHRPCRLRGGYRRRARAHRRRLHDRPRPDPPTEEEQAEFDKLSRSIRRHVASDGARATRSTGPRRRADRVPMRKPERSCAAGARRSPS
jgi:hypothetical protein